MLEIEIEFSLGVKQCRGYDRATTREARRGASRKMATMRVRVVRAARA